MSKISLKEAIDVLKSDKCDCGRGKAVKKVFCAKCYSKLPSCLKRVLYDKIGDGFEEAVYEAREYLKGGK